MFVRGDGDKGRAVQTRRCTGRGRDRGGLHGRARGETRPRGGEEQLWGWGETDLIVATTILTREWGRCSHTGGAELVVFGLSGCQQEPGDV